MRSSRASTENMAGFTVYDSLHAAMAEDRPGVSSQWIPARFRRELLVQCLELRAPPRSRQLLFGAIRVEELGVGLSQGLGEGVGAL